ncbi:hypothetical protein [Nonomuraea basaltis]|uniref:hypothetical protein n=1 Tax=Nonomuraea basaltis TaxID=2495887 RepID=UPI00110C5908|nr:hypothetical protein [Nonomuraea basaltis]TMR96380.1 hypothetical protein EJK15_23605 [Nonomuraea basaltis]
MTELGGWLWAANLKGFMLAVSEIIGYEFDNADWDAIELGISQDPEKSGWFSYPLGSGGLEVFVSTTTEEGSIDLKIHVPDDVPCLPEKIGAAWMVFNQFTVSPEVEIL